MDQLERHVLIHKCQFLVDISRVRFRVTLGVVIGHILLQLAMHICIAVVQEETGNIILLDQLNDPLCYGFVSILKPARDSSIALIANRSTSALVVKQSL